MGKKPIPAKNKGGDCFEAAGNFIVNNRHEKDDLILVHGLVTGQGAIAGIKFAHAWIEDGDLVIDKSNGRDIKIPKMLYYALGNVKKTFRYTAEEAVEKMLDVGHYGPWDLKSEY
jgi:hypothetical protein